MACLWPKAVHGKEARAPVEAIEKAFSSSSRGAGSPLVWGFSMGTGGESRPPTFNRVQWTHSAVGRSSTGEKQYWGELVWRFSTGTGRRLD